MALTDTAVRLARPRERVYRLNDGRGLCILIQTNGAKWWRFRYRWQGREQMLSLETYPDTPLLEARKQRDTARQQLAQGVIQPPKGSGSVILLIVLLRGLRGTGWHVCSTGAGWEAF